MPAKRPRPPGNLSHLQRLAKAAADSQQMPVKRYQRWVNVQILSAALERVRDEQDEPLFVLKGGAAMELRLGLAARASADYDATFRARRSALTDKLDEALSEDWNGFFLQRTEIIEIRDTSSVRTDIKLAYKGKPWGTMQLEIGPAEGAPGMEIDHVRARPLDALQLDTPAKVACVSIRYQIAQKIHACTEVYTDGGHNDRFRDLIDLELLRELTRPGDRATIRDACVAIFISRNEHSWPPTVTIMPGWADGFRAMAREIDFFTDEVEVAAQALRDFIAALDAARG